VLLEQHVGDAGLRVEQEEEPVARGQAPLAVPVEPGRDLEHDVAPARDACPLHVHFGGDVGQLEDQRVGERGLAAAQRPEALFHGGHGDRHGDAVAERFQRDDPHRAQSVKMRFRPSSVSASAACSSESSLP